MELNKQIVYIVDVRKLRVDYIGNNSRHQCFDVKKSLDKPFVLAVDNTMYTNGGYGFSVIANKRFASSLEAEQWKIKNQDQVQYWLEKMFAA